MQLGEATTKIQSALAARAHEIDGIIATGFNPTVAAASILTEWHKDPHHKRIRFVGIDTQATVLQAIREGAIDATIAQNPFGHGYASCAFLKLLLEGWTPQKEYQFVNAGFLIVRRDNLDSFPAEIRRMTDSLVADLKIRYLKPPE
jgi:ribose transport system substrate-binding protein